MTEDLRKYQSKSIILVDDYVCMLSDELKKISKDELGETDKVRKHAIKALRDWALANPRIIKCRLDSVFLLRALRFRKFSIPKAQEMIERYLIYREGLYGHNFVSNLDPLRPNLFELLDKGFVIPLPKRNKNGCRVLMLKLSELETSYENPGDTAMALLALILEVLMEDEENQIRGINYIADFSGMTLKQVTVFPLDAWYKFGKNAEKNLALRHKGISIVNISPTLSFFMNFAIKHMSEKLQKRVKFFSCPVAETGIVELENLPIEHGGKIPLKIICDEWKKILLSKRDFYLNYNNMKIDKKMYPKNVLECTPESLKTPINEMDFVKNFMLDKQGF